MSDHHHADGHGLPESLPVVHDLISDTLMIPATAVTGLLRAIATHWTTGPCPDCRRTARFYAALLTGVADQFDVECIAIAIAAAEQQAGPTG